MSRPFPWRTVLRCALAATPMLVAGAVLLAVGARIDAPYWLFFALVTIAAMPWGPRSH